MSGRSRSHGDIVPCYLWRCDELRGEDGSDFLYQVVHNKLSRKPSSKIMNYFDKMALNIHGTIYN